MVSCVPSGVEVCPPSEGSWRLLEVPVLVSSGSSAELDEEPRCCHLCSDTPEYSRDPGHHSGQWPPRSFRGVQSPNVYGRFKINKGLA